MSTKTTKKKSTSEKHQFGAETSKILQLMIHSLYAHKDIFLRELISNASDACDKLRYNAITKPELLKEDTDFAISLIADTKKNTLTIKDNGVGMNKKDMIDNLGTIASSGTQKFLDKTKGDPKEDIQLIGQFGVGFYSAFMVADKVTVISTKAGQKKSYIWESKGDGNYTIDEYNEEHTRGTTITLHLREDAEQFTDKHRVSHIVKTYSDHISFPVTFTDSEGETSNLNEGAALWTRNKSAITKEQYQEFYKHVAHAGDEPWMTLHNKAEGTLEYTSLLFIPSTPPFDLFHPDRMTRVKLYVKRVFIAEENVDIIPQHFRFIRGIVDSEDLPLNISRETLQHNNLIHKIRNNIVKKIISELKKKAKNDKASFDTFWNNFGATLKEGLCEAVDANRENLLEICHFRSSHDKDKLITLDQYIEQMPQDQDKIYYAIGDSPESLLASPQLEGFIKKGINVILLTDHVDDFWVNTMHEYKEKDFVSVTRAGLDADQDEETKDNDTTSKEDQEEQDKLIAFMKDALSGKVLDVVISKKLTSSPVCLSVQEGGMDMRMERFLLAQKQLAKPSLKVLEINLEHPVVKHLAHNITSDDAKELSELLFDQACIIEGESIYDTSEFTTRFNKFLEKALAS